MRGPDGKLWVTWVRQSTDLRMRTATVSGSAWTWSPALNNVPDSTDNNPYDHQGIEITAGFNSAKGHPEPRPNAHNPQIMADQNNIAYILYTDYDSIGNSNYGRIGMIRYNPNAGPQFVSLADALNDTSAPTIYTGLQGDDWLQLTASVRLRAGTVPSAKFDRTSGRICVTWHERNGAGSRVKFASYRAIPFNQSATWSTITVSLSSGHNILPAMDFDPANGNHMITWYAVTLDQSAYSNVGSYVTFSGDTPSSGAPDFITFRSGNMANLTPLTVGGQDRIIGDYHEVSFTNGSFKAAHILAASSGVNPWAFYVTP